MSKYFFSVQKDGYRYEQVAMLEYWRDTTIDNQRLMLILQWHDSPHGVLQVMNPFNRSLQFVKEVTRYVTV